MNCGAMLMSSIVMMPGHRLETDQMLQRLAEPCNSICIIILSNTFKSIPCCFANVSIYTCLIILAYYIAYIYIYMHTHILFLQAHLPYFCWNLQLVHPIFGTHPFFWHCIVFFQQGTHKHEKLIR